MPGSNEWNTPADNSVGKASIAGQRDDWWIAGMFYDFWRITNDRFPCEPEIWSCVTSCMLPWQHRRLGQVAHCWYPRMPGDHVIITNCWVINADCLPPFFSFRTFPSSPFHLYLCADDVRWHEVVWLLNITLRLGEVGLSGGHVKVMW